MKTRIALVVVAVILIALYHVPVGTYMVDDRFVYGGQNYMGFEDGGIHSQSMSLNCWQYFRAKKKGWLYDSLS